MKVKVFHANTPNFGFETEERPDPKFPVDFIHAADVEVDEESNEQMMQHAFQQTNHIDRNWTKNEEVTNFMSSPRSTSVGDVLQIKNRHWRVAMVGFEEIKVPNVCEICGTLDYECQHGPPMIPE